MTECSGNIALMYDCEDDCESNKHRCAEPLPQLPSHTQELSTPDDFQAVPPVIYFPVAVSHEWLVINTVPVCEPCGMAGDAAEVAIPQPLTRIVEWWKALNWTKGTICVVCCCSIEGGLSQTAISIIQEEPVVVYTAAAHT